MLKCLVDVQSQLMEEALYYLESVARGQHLGDGDGLVGAMGERDISGSVVDGRHSADLSGNFPGSFRTSPTWAGSLRV